MKISEIFVSIDGEGAHAGGRAVFVRTAGCNLRCGYCDTSYALCENDGYDIQVTDIVDKILSFRCPFVTFTGGEPLLQPDAGELLESLRHHRLRVDVETNGSVDIRPFIECNATDSEDYIGFCVDYKLRSSGMGEAMCLATFESLRPRDTLKFVMDPSDEDEVREVLLRFCPASRIYLSPIYGRCDPAQLVEILHRMATSGDPVLETLCQRIFVQVQLHKIIWPATLRGV